MFNKKKEDEYMFDTDDRLIIWSDDNKECNIYNITEITDESVIAAGRAVVPKQDCELSTSEEGRIYLYKAPQQSIKEVERLARLEQSIVLKQITNYKPEPVANPNLDMKFWALAVLLFVAIIITAF